VRLNLTLLAVLTVCALGLVTSQHQSRKYFAELEREQERARALDVEFGQLQIEQSTWALHPRIEKLASQALRMRAPEAGRVQVVSLMKGQPGQNPVEKQVAVANPVEIRAPVEAAR
jgi:cell division protein FtsL